MFVNFIGIFYQIIYIFVKNLFMGFFKENINAILGTILFHLLIVASAMFFKITTSTHFEEAYTYVDIDFIKEMTEEETNTKPESNNDIENFDVENYISKLKNVGSNYSTSDKSGRSNQKTMSEAELKQKYETELLKEKYGDNYEKMKNTTYENYLKEVDNNTKNNTVNQNKSNQSNSGEGSSSSYSGPALVFVELENKNRGNSYIHVPVFTCKDGGSVVVKISISSDGSVKTANIESAKSNGDVNCISNEAKEAALKSRFTNISGTKTEYGKITYKFIEQ